VAKSFFSQQPSSYHSAVGAPQVGQHLCPVMSEQDQHFVRSLFTKDYFAFRDHGVEAKR
jgi:hypothetical protein